MKILDRFKRKTNPDVEAAGKRAYDDEMKIVKRENKNAAIRKAVAEAKEKARSQSSSRKGSGSSKVEFAKKVGAGIMSLGNYGASLNWGGNEEPQGYPRRGSSDNPHPAKKGKKGRKIKKSGNSRSIASQFEMPEFPF